MKLRYALLPAMIALTFGPAAHAVEDDRIYVAPMASFVSADQDRYSDDGVGGTLAIGFPMTPSFSLEVRGSYLDFGDSEPPGFGATAHKEDIWDFGAGVNWYLFNGGIRPYLHADVLGGDAVVYNAGLGLDFPIFDSFGLRAEALYHVQQPEDELPDEVFTEVQYNLGVLIPFGAKPVAPPPPPPPPPPVCSDGLDNDGDGAIDFPADKGCTDASDMDEYNAPICSDGLDNDGDGAIDFPADKGCIDGNDMDEYNPPCTGNDAGQTLALEGCGVGDKVVLQGVTFEFDKDRLTPNAKTVLDGVVTALESRPDIKVEVGGHTDFKGTDEYNFALSDRRSKSVKDYLVSKGIAAERLTTHGYGESMPIADNNTDIGRAINRRVELKVTESNGSVEIAPTKRTAEFAEPLSPAE